MDRRRELKEQFNQMRPEMGVYVIESQVSGKVWVDCAVNLRSAMNSSRFKLNAGIHPCRELQAEWIEHGGDRFVIRVLDKLEYTKDASKSDYTDELDELRQLWIERLVAERLVLYAR